MIYLIALIIWFIGTSIILIVDYEDNKPLSYDWEYKFIEKDEKGNYKMTEQWDRDFNTYLGLRKWIHTSWKDKEK